MGIRFLATQKSIASDAYREVLVSSGAEEVVYTASVSTLPANFLRDSLIEAGYDPESLPAPGKVDVSHVTNPHAEESTTGASAAPKAWRDVWSAGQSVAGVDAILPVAELVDRLEVEYEQAKTDLPAVLRD